MMKTKEDNPVRATGDCRMGFIKLVIFLFILILLSCGTRRRTLYPKTVIHPTDSGVYWLYKNHERAELVRLFLPHPTPDTLDFAKVNYFPNG